MQFWNPRVFVARACRRRRSWKGQPRQFDDERPSSALLTFVVEQTLDRRRDALAEHVIASGSCLHTRFEANPTGAKTDSTVSISASFPAREGQFWHFLVQ